MKINQILESITAGASGTNSIATAPSKTGKVIRRQDNILAAEADQLRARGGIEAVNKKPRPGQTDYRDIPAGNYPGSQRKFSDKDREEQPSRLKSAIKTTLGKHTKPNLPEQGVAEGLPQTLRKVVPGYAKREIDRKMDAEKFGRTDVDKDANYYRYKKIQDKLKGQGVAEVAGAQSCWPGHRKVGTQPGTGKNAGKSVNKCKEIGEDSVEENKKGVRAATKPRNFVAKNAAATTSGAGAHKDKKKAMKQGDTKHKGKEPAYESKLWAALDRRIVK